MVSYPLGHQPDLFTRSQPAVSRPPMSSEFVDRIRSELIATLKLVTNAAEMPWSDLTAATLAELRFTSIADWLPQTEADSLRDKFDREMSRLWEVANRDTAGAA